MRSDSLVAQAVEEGLAPGLVNVRLKFALINGVLNLGVDNFAIYFALEEESTVFKTEGGSFRDCDLILIIANLQKNLIVFKRVSRFFGKFSECNEIVRVDTV